MRILTAEEMREADAGTFAEDGVSSLAIMEMAGRAVSETALRLYSERVAQGVLVVCGTGNNGADGFVTARQLSRIGVNVRVLLVGNPEKLQGDAKANYLALVTAQVPVSFAASEGVGPSFLNPPGLVIDAILGTGIASDLREPLPEIICELNERCQQLGVPILSVDLPSGLWADSGEIPGPAIRATHTVCLQALKNCHVLLPASTFAGTIDVAEIGVRVNPARMERYLLTPKRIRSIVTEHYPAKPNAHKGTRGHVLIIGGRAGLSGAPVLAAEAALSFGAGLVTILALDPIQNVQITPEIMIQVFRDVDQLAELVSKKDAVLIGPGLGTDERAVALLQAILGCARPLIFDADALNILALHESLLRTVPAESLLTPHPGEMSRLARVKTEVLQNSRLLVAEETARKLQSVVVLKGARTVISSPNLRTFVNPAACELLGTAGSGDVLAGMISAVRARGLSSEDSALLATFIHGQAGHALAKNQAYVLASEIYRKSSELLALERFREEATVPSFRLTHLESI